MNTGFHSRQELPLSLDLWARINLISGRFLFQFLILGEFECLRSLPRGYHDLRSIFTS